MAEAESVPMQVEEATTSSEQSVPVEGVTTVVTKNVDEKAAKPSTEDAEADEKKTSEMDKILLRRFCFLGSCQPVYIHLRPYVKVSEYWSNVSKMVQYYDPKEFTEFIYDVFKNAHLVRYDEAIFVYAAYLACAKEDEWKTVARSIFNELMNNDDKLFRFCKYAYLISEEQKRRIFSRTVRKAVTNWYQTRDEDNIHALWLSHRGLHGFTHKSLIKLCRIKDGTIGSKALAEPFFKSCTKIMKDAGLPVENENTEERPSRSQSTPTPTNKIVAGAKLRTTNKKHDAIKIIRKFKLPYSQVPGHLLRYPVVMEALLPTMSYLQILKCWRKMAFFNHFEVNPKIFTICKKLLENITFAKNCRVHPIHILMKTHDIGSSAGFTIPQRKLSTLKLEYLESIYKQSFNWPTDYRNLRMHITVNLQANYKKKFLRNHKKLSYYDACRALSVGFCKRETKVDIFHWIEKDPNQLNQINFPKNFDVVQAFEAFDMIENKKNKQRLIAPLINALASDEIYDVFLCIVPTAGRGNPRQSSKLLCSFLDKYRETKNPKARFIILDLLKFNRRSMAYSSSRVENILEICGLDYHTTDLIYDFATYLFD